MKKEKFHKDTFENTTSMRRKKVLDEAIAEFANKGYHATSINEIARNANISIGAMYSYFASKEDLFLSIVNDAYELMNQILETVSGITQVCVRVSAVKPNLSGYYDSGAN